MQRDIFADKLEADQATINGELTANTLTITNQGTINTITPYTSYTPITAPTGVVIASTVGAYIQVGPIVTGWLKLQVTPSATGNVSYTFPLPVTTTAAIPVMKIGSVVNDNNSSTFENIICNIENSTTASVKWIAASTTATEQYVQFTYVAY